MNPDPAATCPTLHLATPQGMHQLARGGVLAHVVGDTYRDTPASDLHEIIADVEAGTPWRQAVAQRYAERNPWLFKVVTDPSRDLFFRRHSPPAGARILDIGAGWGQIALPLARTGFVCALEPTPERLRFIQAAARQEGLDNSMWFVQADFFDVDFEDRFDLITCIGVLEWVPKFARHLEPIEAQRQFLARIRKTLAPGGQLVIGIENRLGLKYLLGAPDDHLGHPHIAVYDAALADKKWRSLSGQPLPALTHTRAEYDQMLSQAGFSKRTFWSAFPDYKIPSVITRWGPETDALLTSRIVAEHDGLKGKPLPFQVEIESHYRSLAILGIASDFVPSFFIVCSEANLEDR